MEQLLRVTKQRFVYMTCCVFFLIVIVISFHVLDVTNTIFQLKTRRHLPFRSRSNPAIQRLTSQTNTSKRFDDYTRKYNGLPKSAWWKQTSTTAKTTTITPTTTTLTPLLVNTPTANVSSVSSLSYLDPKLLSTLSFAQLKSQSQLVNFSAASVPKIVHQSWKKRSLPPRFKKWGATWKKCFPDWEYKLWTDEDNDNLVHKTFPWFYKRYSTLTSSVQKADAVRYLYMFAEGGIYSDLDNECLKPFPQLLEGYPVIFGAMEGHWFGTGHASHLKEGYVQNSFMYSVPGHPLWLSIIETIMARPPSASAESTTGPFMLQEVIKKWRQSNPKRSSELKIYPPTYFNPFSWIKRQYPECKDVNSMTSSDIQKCKAHYPESYVIQYHTQTWGRGHGNTFRNDRR